MLSDRIHRRIASDFPADADAQRALASVMTIAAELAAWREAQGTDRIELACLILAAGDLAALSRAVDHAVNRDWRDILVAAGIG